MKDVLKFLLTLGVAMSIMLAVRAWALTLYAIPADGVLPPHTKGERLLVARWMRTPTQRGGEVVWTDSTACYAGRVAALPGDTITVDGRRYRIPMVCCRRCGCADCKLYVVEAAHRRCLIHQHQIVGSVIW